MSQAKRISTKIFATSVCSFLYASTVVAPTLTLFPQNAQAQSRRVRYVPPNNLDAPKVSASGITRSTCASDESICLIALLPDLELVSKSIPQTVSEHPTIYFLIPKFDGKASFSIREVQELTSKSVYVKDFDLKVESGVIAFKMPMDAPILEIGKSYKFNFTLKNPNIDKSKNVFGHIHRVLPSQNLVDQLKKASSPVDRAALYSQSGIWFETLQTLAEAQQTVPQNIEVTEEWLELLKSAKINRALLSPFVTQIPKKQGNMPSTRSSDTFPKPSDPMLKPSDPLPNPY
jgi:Domain of Unknown Function (DUF928)